MLGLLCTTNPVSIEKMARIFILILLVGLSQNNLAAQNNDIEKTILEYGHPLPNEVINARATIAEKWGITFKSVAGCFVSEHLRDSIKNHNESTRSEISREFGIDWESKFEIQLENELEIQLKARKLINSQAYMREGNKKYYLILSPGAVNNSYDVKAFNWGDWNGEEKLVVFYEIFVDVQNAFVLLRNDQKKLLEME